MRRESNRPTVELYSSVGGALAQETLLSEWESAGWPVARRHELTEREYRVSGRWSRMITIWRMYVVYPWCCGWRAQQRKKSPPLRVVTTNPFFNPSLIRWSANRRSATVMLLYDLFPDVLVLAGKIRAGGYAEKMLAAITRYALRECEATVFLGAHLRRFAEAKYGPARRAVIIPVGAPGALFAASPPRMPAPGSTLTILYAGAMGHMHDVDTVHRAMQMGAIAGICWRFHSSGAGYRLFKKMLSKEEEGEKNAVALEGPLADAEWTEAMRSCPIALVTLRLGAENLVMPSKTYSALVAGQAILAICARQSDLAELIERHDCGWVVEPGDVMGLRAVLQAIASGPEELQHKRLNAFTAGHDFYSAKVVARQWRELFASITQQAAEC
jgi:colanic acid biosynthesis glycosyl transferase WcaI